MTARARAAVPERAVHLTISESSLTACGRRYQKIRTTTLTRFVTCLVCRAHIERLRP